jgi:outer membrane protein assembly factor BamB
MTTQCVLPALAAAVLVFSTARADDWPQWLGPKRDGVWRETGIIKKMPKDGPTYLWRQAIGEGYAGPAVAHGKVYVTDWVRDTNTERPKDAFAAATLPGVERVQCLDAKTGKEIWIHKYDCPYRVSYAAGPRCAPLIHDGKVYTLGTMGHLFCLEADSGNVVWSKNFVRDYEAKVPLWGFAGHPLIDGEKLICIVGGKKDSMVVAFNKDTGKQLWSALTTFDATHGPGYCSPVLAEVGKTRQVIVWYPEAVSGVDPETGKVNWTLPFQLKAGMAIATPRVYGDRVFLTAFYNGPMMLQLAQDNPSARVLWKAREGVSERNTDGLHAVMCTPFLKDGYIYGVCSYGQLRCLKIDSGERIWDDLKATGGKEERWGNAFLMQHEDRVFIFNEHGFLILANMTPDGYEEIGRMKILEPTNPLVNRPVVWMHPAFANKSIYARNDKEIVRIDLSEK